MLCSTCGAADNPEKAAFCQLCLSRFEAGASGETGASADSFDRAHAGASTDREWWLKRRQEFALAAEPGFSEHQWWLQRRADYAEAVEKGLPPKSGVYALAALDTQARFTRATWWSASILIISAWLVTLPLATFDWRSAVGIPSWAPTLLLTIAIGCLGIAVARACAARVSGTDAWSTTLVRALFWAPAALLLATAAVSGGVQARALVSVYAIAAALVSAIVPVARGCLVNYVPRP